LNSMIETSLRPFLEHHNLRLAGIHNGAQLYHPMGRVYE
jgi:hypothetical protein